MINFAYSKSLSRLNRLSHGMFTDRAKQFSERLGWDVTVSCNGEERDEYDLLNPLYVIISDVCGRHAGSMRFLPTTGRTMVNEHFTCVTDGVKITSPFIWECTRFCVSDTADRRTSARLMAAGAKLMQEFALQHFVGVFDRRMETIYKRLGASPTVVGRKGNGRDEVGVGLWEFNPSGYLDLLEKSGLTDTEMELFLVNSDIGGTTKEAHSLVDKIVA